MGLLIAVTDKVIDEVETEEVAKPVGSGVRVYLLEVAPYEEVFPARSMNLTSYVYWVLEVNELSEVVAVEVETADNVVVEFLLTCHW